MKKKSGIQQQKGIRKKINIFFVLLILAVLPLSFLSNNNLTKAIAFLIQYFIVGFFLFNIAKYWVSTITIFYLLVFVSCVFGIAFFLNEGLPLCFNPYMIIGAMYICLCGYLLGINVKSRKKKHHKFKLKGILSAHQALIITFILSTIAWAVYFSKNHNILSGNLNDARIEAASGNGALLYLLNLHIMTIPYLYSLYKKSKISGLEFWSLFLFASFQLISYGFRSPVMTIIIVIVVYNILLRKISFEKILIVLPILIILLFVWGNLRSGVQANNFYNLIRNQFSADAWNLNRVIEYFPTYVPFQHGYTYLINIIMLKPGPDPDFTLWLKSVLNLEFSGGGVTPTIFGEFYMNFNYWGVFVGIFLLGMLFGNVDKWIFADYKNIEFWKPYIMFSLAASASGGLSNIYLLPIILGLYYSFLKLFIKPQMEM